MLSYCLNSRKKRESKTPKNPKTNNKKPITLSKCATCDMSEMHLRHLKISLVLVDHLLKAKKGYQY